MPKTHWSWNDNTPACTPYMAPRFVRKAWNEGRMARRQDAATCPGCLAVSLDEPARYDDTRTVLDEIHARAIAAGRHRLTKERERFERALLLDALHDAANTINGTA